MKNSGFAWLVVLPFCFFSCRENRTSKATVSITTVSISQKEFDFGEIKIKDSVGHKFGITNTGPNPLLIKDVKASCGCTTSNWTRHLVKKDSSASIDVAFNARAAGIFRKSIVVELNADTPYIVFYIKGVVVE